MRIPQLGDDAVRLRFIPFSLKDLARKWLLGHNVGRFRQGFLEEILPNTQDCPHQKEHHVV